MHLRTAILAILPAAVLACVPAHATLIAYTDLASFDAAANAAVVEDFESAFPKNVPLGAFSHNGISYTPYAGSPSSNVWVAGPGYPNFGTPVTTTSILTANGDEDWLMTFTASTAVGFDTYLNQYGPATIRAYGASGLLGTYTVNHNPAQVGFFGLTSDAEAITSLRWTTVGGGIINTGIDNIRLGSIDDVTPGAVPEPSTFAMFGMALAAAGLAARRRKRG